MARDVEQTKQRFRQAGLVEFAEHGLHGTTVERIARRAGVNKERLYRYFDDKAGLFAQVVRAELDEVAAAVSLEIASAEDAARFAGRAFDYQLAHPDLARLVLWEGLADVGAVSDEVSRSDLYTTKVEVMAAAQRRGAVNDDIEPAHLVFFLLALASWWAAAPQMARMLSAAAPGEADTDQHRRAAVVEAARRLTEPRRVVESSVVDARPLAGTVALVTGASSGIGKATAIELAARGAAVALVARRADRLDALAAHIEAGGGRALAIQADITQRQQAQDAVERTVTELGRLDTLVNSAGLWLVGPVEDAPTDEWDRMIDVNINGLLHVTHAAVPHLLRAAQGGPRNLADLINVSSVAGKIAFPTSAVYGLTKSGVGAFSESLRQELTGRHVRVAVIEPGRVATEINDHLRDDVRQNVLASFADTEPLEPEDVADVITWLVTRPRRVAINELIVRPTEQKA